MQEIGTDGTPQGVKRRMTAAEKVAASVARHADVGADFDAALPKVDRVRRARCAKSLVAFARTYCTGDGGFLEDAPPPSMRGILEEMQVAICDASTPYHIRVARGHGKTSYMKCAVVFALSYGYRRYVVSVASDARKAAVISGDIVAFMANSPAWAQDFPEISVPLKRLKGAYQRARTQTCHGENTDIRLSAADMRLPTVRDPETGEKYPTSGAVLTSVGLTGNARGLVRGSLRPDLVLFDDIQSDDMAGNEERVAEAAQLVRKAFMGLAGHRRKIAAIMTSTPIAPDDLSETFAADKSWKTTTYPMVKSFPVCFGAKDGDLWAEYSHIYQTELAAGRKPHIAANRFYREHRAEMDAGAEVLNPRNYDNATELSAIQHALNIYYRDGEEAFLSEYQMKPPRRQIVFELSAATVISRTRKDWPAYRIPPESVMTVCATDLNPAYGYSSVMATFDRLAAATVVWYGIHKTDLHKEKMPEAEYRARVYDQLVIFARRLQSACASRGIYLDAWAVDAGGDQFEPVMRLWRNAKDLGLPFEVVPMIGRAGQGWNPYVRTKIRNPINETVECGDADRDGNKRHWTAFNADFWRETMQRSWLGEIGSPGGLSLFGGSADIRHDDYALQVSAERLRKKETTSDGRTRYTWIGGEARRHDYGDATTMCLAIAGNKGLTQGAEYAPHKKRIAKLVVL